MLPRSKLELYQEYPDPAERETIDAITDLLIGHLKIQYRDQPKLRDTHTKSNGLINGRFQDLPNLPDELRVGLFSEPRSYDSWIRFSNSDSFISNDKAKDFRGISLKLFEVEGETLQPDEAGTFDFILLGNDAFFAKHARDFLAFFRLLFRFKKPLGPLLYILTRWRQAYNLLLGRRVFGNPLEINWFSAVPYRFGNRAVKYRIHRRRLRSSQAPRLPKAIRDQPEDQIEDDESEEGHVTIGQKPTRRSASNGARAGASANRLLRCW